MKLLKQLEKWKREMKKMIRFCKRCNQLFNPKTKHAKICEDCYKPKGGRKRKWWNND